MLAITHARLIDGSGAPPLDNATILIRDGRFVSVAAGGPVPAGAQVIDAGGRTAIPGLSDAHVHLSGSSSLERPGLSTREQSYDFAEARDALLHWGVLTVRTAGDFSPAILRFRDDARAGRIPRAPRVLAAGPMFQARGGHPCYTVFGANPDIERDACVLVDDDTDIEAAVARTAAQGVDIVKAFYAHLNKMNYPTPAPRISRNALERLVRAAHQNGKRIMVHVDDAEEFGDAVDCGADSIEHMIGVGAAARRYDDGLIARTLAAGAVVVPTMISILRFDPLPGAEPVWEDLKTAVGRLYRAGVPLAVGCDAGVPFVPFGESVHDELACLAEAGIPPLEVLRLACQTNARLFGLEDCLGGVRPGLAADLLLLEKDPLADIRNSKTIRLVLMDGRVVRDELLADSTT